MNRQIEGRIAVYIAGNSGIFFPGLIALGTIKQQNAHLPLDFYVFYPEASLTAEHVQAFKQYGITYVPSEVLYPFGDTSTLPLMKEGQWPAEVFDNWVAPKYLRSIGYEFAVKADYDILCLSPYLSRDISGFTELFAGVDLRVDLVSQGLPANLSEELEVETCRLRPSNYMNVGFVAINLSRYVEEAVFEDFASVYSLIMAANPDVPNLEQAAIAVIASRRDGGFKAIDPSYNVRATTLPKLDDEGTAVIKNVHFITHNKPWRKPNFKYLSNYVPGRRTCVYIYRDVWLRIASSYPGFNRYVETDVPSDLMKIGILATVLGEHYRQGR